MWKKESLFWKLKGLTGYSYEKIANVFGVSKQAVQQSFSNHSVTHQNSSRFMVLKMVDIKIKEYQAEIGKLENFKKEIMESGVEQYE